MSEPSGTSRSRGISRPPRAGELNPELQIERQVKPPGSALARRLLSALVVVPLLLWTLYGGPQWLFPITVLLLAAAAHWEFARMFRQAGEETMPWLGTLAGLAVTASFLLPGAMPIVLALSVAAAVTAPLAGQRAPAWTPTALTVLGIVYVNWLLGHALWLRALPQGADWTVLLLAVTWSGETAAYAIGSLVGRYKLAPVISPAKTVEGAVAQVVVSVAAALVTAAALFPDRPLAVAAVAGLLLGVVGQLGDLAESMLKRSVRMKDTGGLIPGHGGVLDRLDSLLFNTPALFYYAGYVS
jgi:phosphatidate cytidylyltransferase